MTVFLNTKHLSGQSKQFYVGIEIRQVEFIVRLSSFLFPMCVYFGLCVLF